jgi:hypothetical protein
MKNKKDMLGLYLACVYFKKKKLTNASGYTCPLRVDKK